MQDKEPNYYRNKKRWDRIVSFLKTGAVILVFGGAAVYLALFLVNLIFRSGPPETSTEQQVERMQQLEEQNSGGGENSGLLAGFSGEPETRSFDNSIPLTTATPDIAVTPLDEDGNPIGGGGGPGADASGPSPQLSGGGGGDDTSGQQEPPSENQTPDQSTQQQDNDPGPTPAQREARRFTEQQAERAAQNDSGGQNQTEQSEPADSSTEQNTQQNSASGDGSEQQPDGDSGAGGQEGSDDGAGENQQSENSDEELQRYQLLTPPLSSRSRAEQQLGTAREIGFNGYLEEITDRGETKYRIEINERFSSYEAAKSARQRLEEAGIQVVLFKRGG